MSAVVISGSVRDQSAVRRWVDYWAGHGHEIIDHPRPIPEGDFPAQYPGVFRRFYERLAECEVLFVMSEDRDGTVGYIGAATFAELSFAVARNACGGKPVEVVLLQPIDDEVHCADEVRLWADLGWIGFPPTRLMDRDRSERHLRAGGRVRSAAAESPRQHCSEALRHPARVPACWLN